MARNTQIAGFQSIIFPRYPRSITGGSRLVYYGAGTRRFCAVNESDKDRWPWKLELRPLVAIPADGFAPTLEEVRIHPLPAPHSHVHISEEGVQPSGRLLSWAERLGVLVHSPQRGKIVGSSSKASRLLGGRSGLSEPSERLATQDGLLAGVHNPR